MNPSRRNLLHKLAAGGALAAAAPFLIRHALAMGDRHYTQGFHKLQGRVLLNDQAAVIGAQVKPGDRIVTGDNGMAVFVLDRDAYLLRNNSRLELGPALDVIKTDKFAIETVGSLTLLAGKMLSVFGKGEKKIKLPTATVGIRGTAIYAEADVQRSYLCTCYGNVLIQSSKNPAVQETVVTQKHDAPRYIYASGEQLIVKAPVINHTDDELFMLEAMVGRMPEFFSPTYDGSY